MCLTRPLIAASLALALSACASMGRIEPRAALLDAQTLQAGAAIRAAAAPVAWPRQQWWQDLHDAQLDRLMETALSGSPGLRVAQARVRQAGALAGIADASTMPKADASLVFDRELFSAHSTVPAPLAGNYAWRNQATLSASYDLDLWGRNRKVLAAALDEVHLASAEAQMARLALQAAMLRTYIQLSLEFAQQDLLEAGQRQRQRIVELARRRQQAGLASAADVAAAETLLPAGARELEQGAQAIAVLRHQLAALCGQGPGDGDAIARPTLALEQAPALPSALPAELIGRRPDIAAQRWRVEAAARWIDVAKADFYPNLNLSAFAGLQSLGFARFLDAGSAVRGVAPALSLPIFAGERLRAQLGNRAALYDAAVEQYNATVIQSLAEVANAVATLQSLARQQRLTDGALATARQAHLLAGRAWRGGLSDAQGEIGARLTVLNEQRQQAQTVARTLDGYVGLMTALGGGI